MYIAVMTVARTIAVKDAECAWIGLRSVLWHAVFGIERGWNHGGVLNGRKVVPAAILWTVS